MVSLEGDSYWSRQGAAVLRNIGLTDLVAATADEYVLAATRLAASLEPLANLPESSPEIGRVSHRRHNELW